MKKLLTLALTLVMAFSLSACGEKKDETTDMHDIINAYQNIPAGIVETDYATLEKFGNLMHETKFRICGIVTGIDEITWTSFNSADLNIGENKIHCMFRKKQTLTEGEYVEIVGELDKSGDYITLKDCVVTERGNTVRERLEK